jgi:hypothetical protein
VRALAVLLLLAGCAAKPTPVPPPAVDCPSSVGVPAAPPRVRTPKVLAQFAISLELAREAERGRGDKCAAAVETLERWIEDHQK